MAKSVIKVIKLIWRYRNKWCVQIWELLQLSEDDVSSNQLFAALALVGWAQQGRELSLDLFNTQTSGKHLL